MAYKKGSKEAKAHMAKVRASKISGVKKKAVAKKTTTRKKAVAKKPVNISYDNSWGKYLDSQRQALPPGRRIAKTTGVPYTENRANRSDIKQTNKKGKMLGIGKGKITGMPKANDSKAMLEIEIFATNDSKLYFSQRLPILKNLYKKYKKGLYDVEKATKLYRYYIDSVMKSYFKTFGKEYINIYSNNKVNNWYDLLSTNDRQILARDFALETLEEFENGEVYI